MVLLLIPNPESQLSGSNPLSLLTYDDEDDDAEDVGDDEPLNSIDDVELIQDDSNVELFDLENVEEVTVPFDLSEKLEILNERRTE